MHLIILGLDFAVRRCPFSDKEGSDVWFLCKKKFLRSPSRVRQEIYTCENKATLSFAIVNFSCFFDEQRDANVLKNLKLFLHIVFVIGHVV